MESSHRFLVIEDDPVDAQAVCRLLKSCGHESATAGNLREAKELLRHERFDAAVLDLGLPDSDGLDGVMDFQASAPEMPVVVVTGNGDDALGRRSVDMGAEDYINKDQLTRQNLSRALDFAIERHRHKSEIFSTLSGLRRSLTRAQTEANTDPLTGLPNRRGLLERLIQLGKGRPDRPFIAALVDVDEFKSVNDRYGHDIGDLALREVAARVLHCLRNGDYVARVGGDEFMLVFGEITREEAAALGRRLMEHVASGSVHARGKSVDLSITIAMVEIQGADLRLEQVLADCHPLLARGKESGRHRLEMGWGGEVANRPPSFLPDVFEPRWYALHALEGAAVLGHRIAFGPDTDGPAATRIALHQARLDGSLETSMLESIQRASAWRAFRRGDRLLALDLEVEALSDRSLGSIAAAFPEKDRPETVLYFDSAFDPELQPGAVRQILLLRKLGFQLGIRGVGGGATVLEHLALIRPEWIRFEAAVTHNIARIIRKGERIASLVSLVAPLRARLVAEGCQPGDDEGALIRAGFSAYEAPAFGEPADRSSSASSSKSGT